VKPEIAIPLGVAGILAAIGTAIANANGWFVGHPHLVYLCWGGSGALIVAAIAIAIFGTKPVPATIKVSPCELHSTASLRREEHHIFLRAKIELIGARRTVVRRYRMELSRAGVLSSPTFRDDVGKWEITDWSQWPIPHDDVRPLPTKLTAGNLVEGWVHFVTNLPPRELQSSLVRFFADTSCGTGTADIPAGREYWNAVPNRMILERN